jgi:hypothetical protein
MYCLSVHSLYPPKPAGLDTPQNYAGIPQIVCGTWIAKKNLENKISRKIFRFFFKKKFRFFFEFFFENVVS